MKKTDMKKFNIVYCIIGILASMFVIVMTIFLVKLGKGYDRFFWDDPSTLLTFMRSKDYHNVAKDVDKYRTYIKKPDENTESCYAVGDYYNSKVMHEAFMLYDEAKASKYKYKMNDAVNNLKSYDFVTNDIDEVISQALERAHTVK